MAETTFEIASTTGGATVTFTGSIAGQPRATEGYTISVRLQADGVEARAQVYDHLPARWARLFEQISQDWRGWQDAKSEESLEGQLRLSFTTDRLGHVRMRVELSGGQLKSDWRAELTIQLEAGQLENLATQARAYFAEDQ